MDSAFDVGDQTRADLADLTDRQMRPLGNAILAKLAVTERRTAMNIGCGAGAATLQLAALVGRLGRVISIDIAPRVLAVARSRAAGMPNVTFLQTDAGTIALPGGSAIGSKRTMRVADTWVEFSHV